ncbi:MAG: VTT domain-containing protein [Candidatus Pacebacteria bacterium]|nr:VTT domain-containing protein [Candidatus Paceibacterota bacterium]
MDYFEGIKKVYLRHRFWILLALSALVLFLIFLPILFLTPVSQIFTHPESIKSFILSYEKWAILVYVLLSIAVVIAPPIPNDIVPIVGGIVFGFWTALLFGLGARLIGSSINYFLGDKIRKGAYLKLVSREDREKLKKYTAKIGWPTVFISRFLPSTDTDLIAYIAGIAKMKYGPFIVASFLGMLLPVSATIFVGASLLKSECLFFILAAFYIIGMLFAPQIIKKFSGFKGFNN